MPTLVHVFPTFGYGGVAIRIATIINRLGSRYRHLIVALDGRFDAVGRLNGEANYDVCRPKSGPRLVATVGHARAFLKGCRPDLLLTYNWGATEWAFANTIRPPCRHIHLESGFGVEEADRQLWRRVMFRRLALARSDRLIVPSYTLETLATKVWKLDSRKIAVIPNGVDLQLFAAAPEVTTEQFRTAPEELVIGTVAPLRPEKNLARLLRVFSRMVGDHPLRLVIAGEGPERPALERLASSLGIGGRTLFLGHVDKVEQVLPAFDIFALLSDTEQMPNSLIQAMAAARPAIAVDVGDVKRILSPENQAYVFDKADEDGLVQALMALAADQTMRTTLGRCNRVQACSTYGLERMVTSYRTTLDDVLAGSSKAVTGERIQRKVRWKRANP